MSPELTFAASLVAAFFSGYICSLIPGRTPRGILRAAFIALLCSPGILSGHGFAVFPSLFALYVQPSIFTLGPMLVVLIIALGIIFNVPALRNYRSAWPPSAEDIFLRAHTLKFVFFGVIAAVLMLALIYSGQRRSLWVAIGGGVAGNAAMAAVLAGVGIMAWPKLRRHARERQRQGRNMVD